MLQWKESHDSFHAGGPKFKLEWSEVALENKDPRFENFKFPDGIESQTFYSSARLGSYKLSTEQLDKLQVWAPCPVETVDPEAARRFAGRCDGLRFAGVRSAGSAAGQAAADSSAAGATGGLQPARFLHFERTGVAAPRAPFQLYGTADSDVTGSAGDLRVWYKAVREGPVTVVGVLEGRSFRPFRGFDGPNVHADVCLDEEAGAGGAAADGGCFDAFSGFLFDGQAVRQALLVRPGRATAEEMFEEAGRGFRNWLAFLRALALACAAVGAFVALFPSTDFFPYFESRLGGLVDPAVAVAAPALGALLWAAAAGAVWLRHRPWILAAALASLSALLYLCGAALDGRWWDPPLPPHLSWTVCAEAVLAAAAVPLGLAAHRLYEDAAAARRVAELNREAGVGEAPERKAL